jgi:uncharacterized protein (TIGR02466 family)
MLEREFYFPTPIYTKYIGTQEYNNYLTSKIIDWSKIDQGIKKSNIYGWHSTIEMHKNPEYQHLVNEIYLAYKEVYKDQHIETEPFLVNMWANINYQSAFNKSHNHANAFWSGVYYVKTPENCGSLILEDTRLMSLMHTPRRTNTQKPKHLWEATSFEPQAGKLIMFPSWVNHYVDPNNSNEPRISISFNFE